MALISLPKALWNHKVHRIWTRIDIAETVSLFHRWVLKVLSYFPGVSYALVVEGVWYSSPCPGLFPLCHMHTASGHGLFNPFLPFSAVNRERHFSCEDCNGNVSGGFDASMSQVGIFVKLFSFLQFWFCWAPCTCWAFCLVDFVWDSQNELVMVLTLKELTLSQGRWDMNTDHDKIWVRL